MLYRIATFSLPDAAKEEFERQSARTMDVIRTLPGYVSDSVYEKIAGAGTVNVITIVAWNDPASIDAAAPVLRAHHEASGFDAAEFRIRNGIAVEEAVFVAR